MVKYTLDAKAATGFESTPFQTTARTGNDSTVFNKARKAGFWYKKHEGARDSQGTYGFSGSSTIILIVY